jgi:hypothetical protein
MGPEKIIIRSASQGIPRLLWKIEVSYRVHKIQLMIPVLSDMAQIRTFQTYFVDFNITLLSTPWYPKLFRPFVHHSQNFVRISYLSHASYAAAISSSFI